MKKSSEVIQSGKTIAAQTQTFIPSEVFSRPYPVIEFGKVAKVELLDGVNPFTGVRARYTQKLDFPPSTSGIEVRATLEKEGKFKFLSKEEILYYISEFPEQQPFGEAGLLETEGQHNIIGFFVSSDGSTKAVSLSYGESLPMLDCWRVMVFPENACFKKNLTVFVEER